MLASIRWFIPGSLPLLPRRTPLYAQNSRYARHFFFCYAPAEQMLEAFYVLATLQVLLGLYSLWEGIRWLRLARRSVTTHPAFYAPRVALICPCKGIDPGLEQNLAALTAFDYPNYEVFFALASAADAAHELLRCLVAASRTASRSGRSGMQRAHIVIAGPAEGCGEKVNNLRAAVAQLSEDFEVLVFADSDGRPGQAWLRHLVAPLGDAGLGAATTFRWYLPDRGGFWSAVAAAWNAAIVTLLGEHAHNFCWGGGTAIRRKVFDEVGALEFWRGSASDDYSLTRALRQAARPVHFVPECLVPTLRDTDFRGLLEFTNRQIIITRVYAPRLWALGALAHLTYCATLLLGLAVLLVSWLVGAPGLHILLLTLLAPLLAAATGYVRLLAVSELLPTWRQKLLAYGWAWTLLAALVPLLYLWNGLVAAATRCITWRGIRYELVSPTDTRILAGK